MSFQEDEKFLGELFMQLTEEDTTEERKKDLVSKYITFKQIYSRFCITDKLRADFA
jgi:hypothetical protein